MQEFSALANTLANEARSIVREYFRLPFAVESKGDLSPVTVADRAVEARLRTIIERERPDDGILGEEYGTKESKNGLVWVIDPIDGTKSFVIGRPTFGTLIALWDGDTPLLGIIDQPISGERWSGIRGQPTLFNGAPIKTRPCASLKEACAASTTPAMFAGGNERVPGILERETKMLAWGADCYVYGLLASGFADLVVEANLSPYDFAALVPVIEGAGGWISDWQGEKLTLRSKGEVMALGDAGLKDDLVRVLGGGA